MPGMQAVYEKCFAILQCALSGSNFIHHAAGILESLLTISHEQLVIDNELIGMAMRAVRGISVNTEKMAFRTIRDVGPGGTYVTEEHTLDHITEEYIEPMLADRKDRAEWEQAGRQAIADKARHRAREILEAHKGGGRPDLIPRQADKEVRRRFRIIKPT
jgi:trimethylamine--corrinoid protein Co-methyltransferase